ncbi:MAG: asparagine synthetase B [Flavobacteriales bacterium]|nr:asparagine synthetase B [Flavobacteriales bacterium]
MNSASRRIWGVVTLTGLMALPLQATYILVPMDHKQENHLKAYGVAYWVLGFDVEMYWLLNYRGGSFMFRHTQMFEKELRIRGVTYELISDAQSVAILAEIADPGVNMEAVRMEKAPKIAVYSPKDKQPWDDAVTLVLTYAEIPYDVIYDDEVLSDKLPQYDWLHLHHEDFTGQYGKFWAGYRNADWYKEEVRNNEATARRWGFSKVSQLKLAVAKKIKEFVAGGGYLFAMCSATDTYDIALAAEGTDICEYMFDGDPMDPHAQEKLDFSKTFAFTGFTISRNPSEYEHSNIDATNYRQLPRTLDFFTLFDFSAKWDIIPTMLTQCHERVIPGFMGQTTAFRKQFIKNGVVILADNKAANEARYIHGEFGRGFWSFYGGHDPEDYQHMVGDPPTNLELFPNSPGYRLILNNVLFPAARKQKQKT